MTKVLFDTSVWISIFGSRRNSERGRRAARVLQFLEQNSDRFTICYSERTPSELNPPIPEVQRFTKVAYHILDETWGQIEGKWGNIGSKWNNKDEEPFAASARAALPDKRTKPNPRRDRGICGDAMFCGCSVLLTEDRGDFSKLEPIAASSGVRVVCLLDHDSGGIIEILERESA